MDSPLRERIAPITADYERGYHGHGKGVVVTQPEPGVFHERPMTPAELAARGPAWEIGKDPYEFMSRAAFVYIRAWEIIATAIETALAEQQAAISTLTLSDHIAAVEAAGYRVITEKPCRYGSPAACGRQGGPYTCPECIDEIPASTGLPKLGKREIEALGELSRFRDEGRRHCWRVASMKKLAAHGLVEFEPGSTQYRNITEAGRQVLAARPRDA